jgi:NAD(P)-dependent dehydrogenase (short-subunit alcohol dehydrogenase family)
MSAQEKIALVTGATRSLGFETVRQLARKGVFVLLGARDLAAGIKKAEALHSEGLAVDAVEIDLNRRLRLPRLCNVTRDEGLRTAPDRSRAAASSVERLWAGRSAHHTQRRPQPRAAFHPRAWIRWLSPPPSAGGTEAGAERSNAACR